MTLEEKYDVIVVGGGHAGCEASHAAATLGSKVLLITQNLETIARMSCNPAMGGVAKGQIIREIDALGGMSGIITDSCSIQFRMLNKSKGPAMWSPRAQCDRKIFEKEWRLALEAKRNIDFWQDTVEKLIIKNKTIITCNNSLLFGDIILFKSENKPSEKVKIIDIKKKLFSSNSTIKKIIIIKKPPIKGIFSFDVNF